MKSRKSSPPSEPVDRKVGHGAQTYSTVLQGAGGEQLKAVMRPGDERAICAALYAAPPYDLRVPAMDVTRLSLNLTPARVIGGIEGERARKFEARQYSLFMAPAGAEMTWRKEASSRHLTIYFRQDLFADSGEGAPPLARRQALHNLNVPGLRPMVDQLVDELRHDGPHSSDAADCLARLLLIQVSRHLGKARDDGRALGTPAMARLKDYVMANLAERLLVVDLARQVGMSTDRFAWACKSEIGLSPHQFVVALRLRQARHLLGVSRHSIAEVAHACGFASQQHMTNAMRRHVGVTPARFRQTMRSDTRPGSGEAISSSTPPRPPGPS